MSSTSITPAKPSLEALLPTFSRDGRDFEHLSKWFLENDPEAKNEFTTVWLWDDWPGRWGRDRGIDLIAQRHDGQIVAIQAKNYGQAHSITKRDVDTFLSESNRREIDRRLLIATTDRVAQSAIEVMEAQQKPVVTRLLSGLLASPVVWPQSMAELAPTEIERFEPRPHQAQALEALAEWADTDQPRAQVIMACGTGKSLLSIWAADQLEAETVLILVPTNQLLRQTATEWVRHASTPRRLLRVCSDNAPDEEAWDRGDELSVDRTTDPAVVAQALQDPSGLLVVGTYQSSPVIAEAMAQVPDVTFDLAIADEAHRCAGLENKSHKTIVRGDEIRARRRLFLTATPTIYGPSDRARAADHNVKLASMDDEAKFGRRIYHLSFSDAIARKLLCPYQVAVIPIEDDDILDMVERHALVTPDGDEVLDAATLATQVACARAMHRYDCRRMVALHPLVTHSKRFSASFPLAVGLLELDERPQGELWSEHVDGTSMSPAVRAKRVRDFKDPDPDSYRLLSNVRLLAEGVDVPGIDAITFVDSRRGHASIIQAVGRAVRRAPGKEVGTIVLPIVTKAGESLEDALSRSEHRHIVEILGALKSHDPEIARSLDDLRFDADKPRRPTLPAGGRFVVDAPVDVGEEFAEAVDIALTNALSVFTKRRRRRVKEPSTVELTPTVEFEPDPDADFHEGFWMLRRLTWNGLLSSVPSADDGKNLDLWWREVTTRWEEGRLQLADKIAVANAVSWLIPEMNQHPKQQREMAELSEVTLPEQVVGQLNWNGIYQGGPLSSLAEEELRDRFIEPAKAIHAAVTHPGMSVAVQLRRLCDALEPLSDCIDDANELPTDWDWPRQNVPAAIDGFVYELELARVGEVGREQAPPPPPTAHLAASQRGRDAAAPLLNRVGKLRVYRSPGAAGAARHRRELELDMASDQRFDELAWEIFMLALARGGGSEAATKWATGGHWRYRQRMRDNFLERSERELERRQPDLPPSSGGA